MAALAPEGWDDNRPPRIGLSSLNQCAHDGSAQCWMVRRYQQPAILVRGMKSIFEPAQAHLYRRPHVGRLLREQQDLGSGGSGTWCQVTYVRPENDKDVLDLSPA